MRKFLFALVFVLCCGFAICEEDGKNGYCSFSFRSSVASIDIDIKEDVFLNLLPGYKEYITSKESVVFGIDYITTALDLHSYVDILSGLKPRRF